jgi:hypothetical protein
MPRSRRSRIKPESRESVLTLTSEVSANILWLQLCFIGLGLDDSLEPRKISQGMVGQVSKRRALTL